MTNNFKMFVILAERYRTFSFAQTKRKEIYRTENQTARHINSDPGQ